MAKNLTVGTDDEVLDLGTGSGIQAITAAKKARRVVATDINPEAIKLAKKNIIINGYENIISVYQGDLFSPIADKSKFNVILFTPPYFQDPVKKIFDHAINDPNKSLVIRFFREADHFLKPNGYIQLLYSSLADPEQVLKIARHTGWQSSLMIKKRILFETFYIYKFKKASTRLANAVIPKH